jgi:hypothetical protein
MENGSLRAVMERGPFALRCPSRERRVGSATAVNTSIMEIMICNLWVACQEKKKLAEWMTMPHALNDGSWLRPSPPSR